MLAPPEHAPNLGADDQGDVRWKLTLRSGKHHQDQGKQAERGTDTVETTPADQQAASALVDRFETGILRLLVRRPHHDQRERKASR
jgi:hypothetical protein